MSQIVVGPGTRRSLAVNVAAGGRTVVMVRDGG
jgi:hypothetical protein